MSRKFFTSFFLILFCSLFSFGQEKPSWIISLENSIVRKEENVKIEKPTGVRLETGFYIYIFVVTSETYRVNIMIRKERDDTPNRRENVCEEMFAGSARLFEHAIKNSVERQKLDNLGDEALIWTNYNKERKTRIHFRRDDIFIEISASTEKTARRFAHYIDDEMPHK